MTESFSNIEDEAFPSFLSSSVGSSRATLGNITLASTLGLPVAASTVAKIRAGADNRWVSSTYSLFIFLYKLNSILVFYFSLVSLRLDCLSCHEGFQMPDVRLAATGMDSCPGSDEEDTEDELEAARRHTSTRHRLLLSSTSRQLVGESYRPSFRPGLEGGSSDEEVYSGRNPLPGLEHRYSAEGQVINTVTGDGSSGSEEGGNDGVSTLPSSSSAQTTYDVLRGLGILGASVPGENAQDPHSLLGLSRGSLMGDRVGPVGTGETSAGPQRMSPVNWSMALDRQEALVSLLLAFFHYNTSVDLDSSHSVVYQNKVCVVHCPPCVCVCVLASHSVVYQNKVCVVHCPPCVCVCVPASHSVVYQNEEGKWVTDLAYYSSFEKEVDGNQLPEVADQFQAEDFVPGNAIEKIIEDQKEFEKENQFMQEEVMEPASTSPGLLSDTSWRLPASSHILMRASQVSQELDRGNQSYLRLSLGTFFQQRSEALGCLGEDREDDTVKRPSFGYVITSPEKREPFPLIQPSDFLSQDSSDLDKTVEADPDRVSPTGDDEPEPCESASSPLPEALLSPSQTLPSASPGSLGPSPGTDQSNLMLSISTIASAIADASISSEPSQLAAMIMELSMRSRVQRQHQKGIVLMSWSGDGSTVVFSVDVSPGTPVHHAGGPEQNQCTFRPSTSPLTHSSPSQTSFPSQEGTVSPPSPSVGDRRRPSDLTPPQSEWSCSSPSLSRLTYISLNDSTALNTTGAGTGPRTGFSFKYSFPCLSEIPSGSLQMTKRSITPQVVIPEELRFPHACCVGISSQTSLGIFNPSERWQQVSITVTSLAINGEKVDSFPYQWLIVKNKTIIGPKSTEEQKVLFIPPQAGVYQAVLSVSSWPASAEAQAVARAEVFAKRVVLVAMAENPALEVDVGKCGSLDFGDLAGGSAKALPLKLLNRTQATVPIRLVISANATAWRCFTFSKSPVAMTAEGLLQAGTLTSLAAPSVMNHVMHASYGENAESFMVWVHFHAPQKYQSCSGDLGPADEYSARVDIEVDCPGPSHVIRSVPLRARSGTARVHAPKDLQNVNLSAALGESSTQTLPLKNAGNIDVQLKLKVFSQTSPWVVVLCPCVFMILPVLMFLCACPSSVLTILVLPSGPQYEVVLKGQVVPEEGVNPAAPGPVSALGMLPHSEVPPILSNKQFVAWGGVTLGRAVQQKLVLRNNSPNTTHHLRLLIRGQDHSCFQLQSSFGQEERLTRHRELSIRPREDVVVHLLFAPTRVACTLSKLEIKQSGVRPSQPGIKFTIPLSGYGGTSNIILEDHRKLSDGYVAMLMGVAAGQVSKLCVCVRNTGCRAAFIKAVPYSDLHTRSVMDSSDISLSPSQFVLKERTQEVITVLMKVTQREQTLCQSANAVLATVCLFCGDEVSRQQFRRLLLSKPDAGRKILSENSLLKGLNFNERFLGEEQVLEAYDLPQSPNQAQLFYGNLSKVVLSVLGSTETLDSGRTDPHVQKERNHTNVFISHLIWFLECFSLNVSLDVLPVKGPQGPALPRTEASGTGTEPGDHRDSWSLQPEQLVLTSPTINGAPNTRHVLIQNHSSRELSFELSWPAHCLTVTPQHGVIEPQYVHTHTHTHTHSFELSWPAHCLTFIKVQIRQDLALDVSTAPADRSLAPLPPQTASPMPTAMLPPAGQPPLTRTAPATVEISNRTIVFPATPSGETSESSVEVENRGEQVRWYLSSFAPPYVKGVDSSGDVYRATYTAFRCPRVSGTLGAYHKMQVPITFLPRDRGDYAQFWDLECHPVAEPQHKTRIRFQLCAVAPQEADCSLVKTEAFKTRRRPDPEEALCRGVYAPQDHYSFPPTRVGETSTLKVNMRNNSLETHALMFLTPKEPFHIKHSKYSLRSQRYIHLPVQFKPVVTGNHSSLLLVQTDTSGNIAIQLTGEALP
uniref:Centrosomal protein 192 n=1 Tax=Oncorhynchus mykiss TaxID=8022 RepID=A0A8K9V8X5_ONCMY